MNYRVRNSAITSLRLQSLVHSLAQHSHWLVECCQWYSSTALPPDKHNIIIAIVVTYIQVHVSTLLYHWISNGCIRENCLNNFCCLGDSVWLENLRLGGGITENLGRLKWQIIHPHTLYNNYMCMLSSPTHCTGWSPRHSTGHHWRRIPHSSGTQCCWSLILLGWDRAGTELVLLSLSLAMSM